MTQKKLQPYRKMEAIHVQTLAGSGHFFWVSQTYLRANEVFNHTIVPLLFSPYKELKDASRHYNEKKEDQFAAILDVRKKAHAGKLVNLCQNSTDHVAFIAMVGNTQLHDNYLRRYYYEQYRAWLKKNKPQWNIREHNAVEPHFTTVFGEPAVKITYGQNLFVIVLLEELEKL